MPKRTAMIPALLLCAIALGAPAGLHADFSVFRSPSHIMSLFALPGETVPFDLASYTGTPAERLTRFRIESSPEVAVCFDDESRFLLTAPDEVGIYPVRFQEELDRPDLPAPRGYQLQLVVMRPASEATGGRIHGYRVGVYPRGDSGQPWTFERPRGFVEITGQNRGTLLSDHFSLADLQCKAKAPYPHYASIQTTLLLKLEAISDQLLQRGLAGDHIRVLSGFRTPEYNRRIGNRTRFSRHIVGDAADIFVDGDGNDRMDDLNGDGRINRNDARYLLRIVSEMADSPEYAALVGGAAAYGATGARGPFVHVDTRGYRIRW